MAKRKIRAIAAETLEIPAEIAFQTMKLVLVGNQAVKAINHQGIVTYETARIRFRTASGAVEVRGSGLSLAELNEEYLRIEGRISSLQLIDETEATR